MQHTQRVHSAVYNTIETVTYVYCNRVEATSTRSLHEPVEQNIDYSIDDKGIGPPTSNGLQLLSRTLVLFSRNATRCLVVFLIHY